MAKPAAAAQVIHAAGAVVWLPDAGGTEVALIHRRRYDDWSFPKGKAEPGEHRLETAVREVAEETGLQVTLGRPLGRSTYLANGLPKHVDYWSARPGGPASDFTANDEVDDLRWLRPAAAVGQLSYQRDHAILAEFTAAAAATVPFILVRHASAGRRRDWAGDDLARPLDGPGAADAVALGRLLVCYGPARVISSAAERCMATVTPYAKLIDAEVEIEPLFTVDQPAGERAAADRAAQIASQGQPALICAHRENLPTLLAAVCGQLGSAAPGGPPLAKGGCLVLHTADQRLVATERQHPADR
jgi:8-oxo-(d)GTP phosphatase